MGNEERAVHGRFTRRIEAALGRSPARIVGAKKCLDAAAVHREIRFREARSGGRREVGRIPQSNQRAAARFTVAGVQTWCTRVIWLDQGRIRADGSTQEVRDGHLGRPLPAQRTCEATSLAQFEEAEIPRLGAALTERRDKDARDTDR